MSEIPANHLEAIKCFLAILADVVCVGFILYINHKAATCYDNK